MKNLNTLLQEQFQVRSADLEKAAGFQRKYGGRLEQILVNMGALAEDALPALYASLLDTELASQALLDALNTETLQAIALNQQLLPLNWIAIAQQDHSYTLLAADPFSPQANQLLSMQQLDFQLLICSEAQKDQLKQNLLNRSKQPDLVTDDLTDLEEDRLRELAGEAPTVNLLNSLFARALKAGASDMHLEPVGTRYRVRFRIDGVLQEVDSLAPRMRLPVASRLKILSGMDIAEKRRPQDGKISLRIANEDLDIRVSTLPLNDGESIVMRFLRQESISYNMDVLGLSADIEQLIREDIRKTAGVVLLTGPTGSGKTTTLYTFLNEINDQTVKIITLEDPVEYQLEGVNQVQVQPTIGFDFAAGLRSIVRQDPDVIMVGEIRDKETAQIAMQSALTGHLVFSTVHTNDAPTAYTRLLDLGVEEYLLNAAIVSIIAQRLVRKLCPHCAEPVADQQAQIAHLQLQPLLARYQLEPALRQAKGCDHCAHTGYKGRVAIVEYLRCDDMIKNVPKDGQFPAAARAINQARNARTLLEDGFLKALTGQTTIEEVMRVAG
ncbi:GspE/PulE family protein [Rheinheimera sp.]|uniref:GspE/PulE family protein n=1 Tax=Rheinheimera sp. TaxID=1869214 RepID=UPI0027BAB770|nr:GspE/PulE family protein [Rheinheimera sp.]